MPTILTPLSWHDQYNRMLRWQTRATNHQRIDHHVIDDCHAFVTCCYHLKDWLINDKAAPKRVVEKFVAGNPWLSLCGDLANGSKHMLVTNPRYKDPSSIESMLVLSTGFGISLMPVRSQLIVRQGKNTYRIHQVVNSSVSQWQGFLRQHELLT